MKLDNSCVLVQSTNYDAKYPTKAFDRTTEITFPKATKCKDVSMSFLGKFDLETGNADCSGAEIDKLTLTKIKADGTTNGAVGKYCGATKPAPMTEKVDLTEFAKLRVRFKNSATTGSAAGFRLQVCLQMCD